MKYDTTVYTEYSWSPADDVPLYRAKKFIIVGPGGYRHTVDGHAARARAESTVARLNSKLQQGHREAV